MTTHFIQTEDNQHDDVTLTSFFFFWCGRNTLLYVKAPKKKKTSLFSPDAAFLPWSYHEVFNTRVCEVRTIHFHVLNLPESTSRKWRNPADFTDWKTSADMQMRAEADTFPSFNFSVLMYHLELHRASSQESLCLWMLMGSLYVNNK